jgi:DNA-binding NarL/FixJ family response regulator
MSDLKPINLLIAEEDPTLRDALTLYLSLEDGIEVVGVADTTEEVRTLARQLQPDVLLILHYDRPP